MMDLHSSHAESFQLLSPSGPAQSQHCFINIHIISVCVSKVCLLSTRYVKVLQLRSEQQDSLSQSLFSETIQVTFSLFYYCCAQKAFWDLSVSPNNLIHSDLESLHF